MSVSIEPFSALTTSAVRDYLVRQGEDSPEIVDWKYFDSRFGQGRERGFACIDNGKVCGVLGLIPFSVLIGTDRFDTAWSCDWYREPSLPGPVGIMLMKQGLRSYPLMYSLGGSTQTRAIMPRLSQYTEPQAGIELHKPLRLGGALRALARAAHVGMPNSIPLVDRLPLQFPIRRTRNSEARITTDLRSALAPVLEQPLTTEPCPAYDLQYIEWQLLRCPVVSSRVCIVPGGRGTNLAILFWCPTADRRFWRLAMIGDTTSHAAVLGGLRTTLQNIMEEGGWMASILVSHLELSLFAVLKKAGFIAAQRRPLFILNQLRSVPTSELRRLSYLDTDYAYRFTSF